MFKFGGWKASLNFSGSIRPKEVYEKGTDLSVGGAYRTHREEFFGHNSLSEPPKRLTPSMVKLPPSNDKLKPSKSANDISDPHNLPPQLRKSAHDVSTDPRGGPSSNSNSSALQKNAKHNPNKEDKKNEKQQKSAEKKRLAEQKKQEKLAMQEQAKKDKLRIQQEKKMAQQQAKDLKSKKGKEKIAPQSLPQASVSKALVPQAPAPPPQPVVQPQPAVRANPMAYSTNTLESSISRTSGPPPYSATQNKQNKRDNPPYSETQNKQQNKRDNPPYSETQNKQQNKRDNPPYSETQNKQQNKRDNPPYSETQNKQQNKRDNPPYSETSDKRPNKNDNTGNTSFSKPIESSSWDMISEHRNQISRNPVASGSRGKQMVMDLQFSFDRAQAVDNNNSEV